MKLLLVDDNMGDWALFSTLIRRAAPTAEIVPAHDGEEALRQLHAASFDVVLLDLNLPRKSGIEVLAEMRSDSKLRDLPVYILTTSSSPDDRERATALGVREFITKPIDFAEIEALFHRLLNVDFPALTSTVRSAIKPVGAESFRLLVEAVRDYAIFMLDPKGYILTWNAGAQRAKHYTPAEIIGKHFSIFYTPEDIRSEHPAEELRIAEKEGRYEEEGWRVRKDGTRFWASVTITALRDVDGKLAGFGKVTRDMTERKMAEEKLRDSEERFRILVEGVRDYAIFMLDPTGRIVSWNKGAERTTSYQAADVIGKHFSIFYTEEAKDRKHPDYELQVAREKGTYEEDGIRVRKDGTTFYATVVITAVYGRDGELRGFSKVTRDITERMRAEQDIRDLNSDLEKRVNQRTKELEVSKRDLEASKHQLEEQKEDLLRSNADLQQFAYVASHDLQEPLRMVISYLQFLTTTAKTKLDERENEFVGYAIDGALRMRQLVQDLLSYARIERGVQLPPEEVSIDRVVAEAITNLGAAIEDKKAKISVAPLSPTRVDRAQWVQVFQNLIANALVYRSADRPLEINIGEEDTPTERIFHVRDNGIGISTVYFQKIFVIFQRLHTDRAQYPGTGIGLSICKKIVERHRGRIWVESKLGEGSTFFFALPRA